MGELAELEIARAHLVGERHLGNRQQRDEGWQQRVLDAVAQRDEEVSDAYRDTYGHNLNVIQEAIAMVLNDRSERQDRHLRSELADLKEDLQTLIAQGQG